MLSRAVAGVSLLLVLTGCSGTSGSDATPAEVAAPAGVSVSVLQYRSDQAVRRIQLKVRNDGTAPVTVIGASLTAPGFVGDAAWTSRGGPDDATIGPGEATDLPAALPAEVTCANTPRPGSATARLRLRGTAATSRPLPVTDPYQALTTVYARDCLQQSAAQVAGIQLVEPLRTEGRRTFLDLRLTPTGRPGTLTVESARSTTLLDPPDGDRWTLDATVGASSGVVTTSLELQPARCDPHAIAEDKLGTVFSLTLHVNQDASGVVEIPAGTKLRGEIQNWVMRACGF
jgi:hypothetical protein